MKRITILWLACVCFAAAVMSGCDNGGADNFFTNASFTEQKVAEGVMVTAEFPEYDKNVETINFKVVNNSDREFNGGEAFRLQKIEEGEWRDISVTGMFTAMSWGIEPGLDCMYELTLKDHVKRPLPSGQYRVMLGFALYPTERDLIAYGEFTIK